MKKRLLFASILFYVLASKAILSQAIPTPPIPARLVNDFAGLLSKPEVSTLENKLVAFNDSTSTQISIVTVLSLDGYDVLDYAQRLGDNWGIGQKELNNGILILVKRKTNDSKGEVAIVTGYGLEGAIPDITCAQIIDSEILPAFRADNYYQGLDNALNVLMSLARGEFSAAEYDGKHARKDSDSGLWIFFTIFTLLIILGIFGNSRGSNNRHLSSGNLPLWLLLNRNNSGGSHKGSWGGFSNGSGGSFGGFGGGGFGGGGASGSW